MGQNSVKSFGLPLVPRRLPSGLRSKRRAVIARILVMMGGSVTLSDLGRVCTSQRMQSGDQWSSASACIESRVIVTCHGGRCFAAASVGVTSQDVGVGILGMLV